MHVSAPTTRVQARLYASPHNCTFRQTCVHVHMLIHVPTIRVFVSLGPWMCFCAFFCLDSCLCFCAFAWTCLELYMHAFMRGCLELYLCFWSRMCMHFLSFSCFCDCVGRGFFFFVCMHCLLTRTLEQSVFSESFTMHASPNYSTSLKRENTLFVLPLTFCFFGGVCSLLEEIGREIKWNSAEDETREWLDASSSTHYT